jgi:hypothetical protein
MFLGKLQSLHSKINFHSTRVLDFSIQVHMNLFAKYTWIVEQHIVIDCKFNDGYRSTIDNLDICYK